MLIEERKVAVETVLAGRFDLSNAAGRHNARNLGNMARYESELKSERLKRKMQELAHAGKVGGGGVRPFGFEADRVTHRTEEVALVREAADRLLMGETLYRIVQDWTTRGVPTSTGVPWSTTSLKSTLVRPRVAGLREHCGLVVARAEWEPVLDEVTWRRIVNLLTDPARRRNSAPRSYLLTGILRCAACGSPMVAAPRGWKVRGEKKSRGSVRAYGCTSNGGCHSVFTLAEQVENFVQTAVLRRLAGPRLEEARTRLAKATSEDTRLLDEILDDERMVDELGTDFADRRISRQAFLTAAARVESRLGALRTRLAQAPRPRTLEGLGDLRAEWPNLSMDRRRAIVVAVLESASVAPATGPRNRFDSNRVRLVWRV